MAKLANKYEKARDNSLKQTGGFLRAAVRQSIRRSIKSSAAGDPPRTHGSGKYTLKQVLFEVNKRNVSVLVGYNKDKLADIARLHEEGGSMTMPKAIPAYRVGRRGLVPKFQRLYVDKTGRRRGKIIGSAVHKRIGNEWDQAAARTFYAVALAGKTFTYRPRPFMAPTIEKNATKAAQFYKDII